MLACNLSRRHVRCGKQHRQIGRIALQLYSRRPFSDVIRMKNSLGCNAQTRSDDHRFELRCSSADAPLTWYSCGPTVYDDAHLGHARTYVCTDIIRRLLVNYFKQPVLFALGITDVDDKIITKGAAAGHTQWDTVLGMARQKEHEFFADLDALNVMRANAVLRVTEHIPDIIAFIEQLHKQGIAYVADDGVYFDVEQLEGEYDKFKCAPPVEHEAPAAAAATAAADDDGALSKRKSSKRGVRDFALWKFTRADAAACEPRWTSPWPQTGRPGWHIECSAMTHSLFGQQLDIHSGGIDLKFPHHTNEIAQWYAVELMIFSVILSSELMIFYDHCLSVVMLVQHGT